MKFSIRPAYAWNPETNTYDEELSRDSDVYVFCLHKHKEQDSINILDSSQWTFFVISTQTLQTAAGMQKTITLNRLKSLGANEMDYDHLRDTVIQTVRSNNQ